MRVLTVRPEYADLILDGVKRIENRRWGRAVRGGLAIHAGRPCKAIVGTVVVAAVLSVEEARRQYPDQAPYITGPWCWVLTHPTRWATPQPMNGKLGLWRWRG